MKIKTITVFLMLALLITACGGGADTASVEQDVVSDAIPVVTVGTTSYTAADLQAMPQAEATFKDIAYVGVPVSDLLSAAGFDLGSVRAVKAVASDGYTVNYEPGQLSPANVIVAYAQVDGPLTADDGDFRMVLPDQEGNMNLRMLVELQVVQ